jgi:hypothetical protein
MNGLVRRCIRNKNLSPLVKKARLKPDNKKTLGYPKPADNIHSDY